MDTWPRGLYRVEIQRHVIGLVLFHLALSPDLVDLRYVPGLLSVLNQMTPILFAWLLGHQS